VSVVPPKIPWQITGNHWLTVPCIHPVDASIHVIGALHAQSRAAIEFAGSPEFLEGRSAALARLLIVVNELAGISPMVTRPSRGRSIR
jgi:hypothetical protein